MSRSTDVAKGIRCLLDSIEGVSSLSFREGHSKTTVLLIVHFNAADFNQAMKQGITTTYNLVQLSSAFLCHLPLYGDHLLFNPILKERKSGLQHKPKRPNFEVSSTCDCNDQEDAPNSSIQ